MNNAFTKRNYIMLAAMVLLIALVAAVFFGCSDDNIPEETTLNDTTRTQSDDKAVVELGEGLEIMSIGNYTGLYFEDGTDETVTNVLMIELLNSSEKDLQLARINLEYTDFSAEFEATNIPSGMSAIILAKNRTPYTSEKYLSIGADNVIFFETPMDKMESVVKIGGGEGYIDVENISAEAFDGTTYVYYKNFAGDKLYGGITYRAKISEALPAGESVRILTNHFTEKNTLVVQVINAD